MSVNLFIWSNWEFSTSTQYASVVVEVAFFSPNKTYVFTQLSCNGCKKTFLSWDER